MKKETKQTPAVELDRDNRLNKFEGVLDLRRHPIDPEH